MSLIEGLGDEVTFVLGSFILLVICLFAWFSTHTDDIPLIREIVVELRMRNRRASATTVVTNEQPQEEEISLSSREGIPSPAQEPSDSVANIQGGNSNNVASSSLPGVELSPSSLLSGSLSQRQMSAVDRDHVSDPPNKVSPSLVADSTGESLPQVHAATVDLHPTLEGASCPFGETQSFTDGSAAAFSSSFLSSAEENREETLRRRRVQYFQADAPTITSDNSTTCEHPRQSNLFFDSVQQGSLQSSVPLTNAGDCDKKEPVPSSSSEDLVQSLRSLDIGRNEDLNHQQLSYPDGNDDQGEPLTTGPSNNSQIRVRLKYMNETQRFVYARPADTIGDFRRAHFQSELQENKWVRFIFNGQDLRDDARTLQACHIENNCTMHCLVTTRQQPTDRTHTVPEDEDDSVLGSMMYPLFTLLLLVVWYLRIFYRQYFSAMSTVCLIGISFLLILGYLSSLRTASETNGQPTAQASGRSDNHPHSD